MVLRIDRVHPGWAGDEVIDVCAVLADWDGVEVAPARVLHDEPAEFGLDKLLTDEPAFPARVCVLAVEELAQEGRTFAGGASGGHVVVESGTGRGLGEISDRSPRGRRPFDLVRWRN